MTFNDEELNIYQQELSQNEFQRLSEFIQDEIGIKMPDTKKSMLEGRLRKRLRQLGMTSFSQYCNYIFTADGQQNEIPHMIDVVTTHKTDFFREPEHFHQLVQGILPNMITREGAGLKRQLLAWSAGCSYGQEAYSLAMVLSDFGEKFPGFNFDFSILATDIAIDVLEKGKIAVYPEEDIQPVPPELRCKFLLRHKDPKIKTIRIVPHLRNRVRFRRLNLLDRDFYMRAPFDIIFIRNVLIYFEPERQEEILARMIRYLHPGGALFLGHSENVNRFKLPLKQIHPSVFIRK